MRCISLYKVGDFFILNPMAKTTTEGLIGSMNFIKVSSGANSETIYQAIAGALNEYREDVINPTDWKSFSTERTTKLKKVGVASESALNKIGNKFCLIKEENGDIEIVPSKNDVSRKYFGHLPDLSEHINLNNDYEEIVGALEKALAKCQ
jgi:hypothetical protein